MLPSNTTSSRSRKKSAATGRMSTSRSKSSRVCSTLNLRPHSYRVTQISPKLSSTQITPANSTKPLHAATPSQWQQAGGFAESRTPEYLSAKGSPRRSHHFYDANPATGETGVIDYSPITFTLGTVAERDAVLTNRSDYDILWPRTVDKESQ